ncbi:MAG: AAA family ATPase, partial [Lachnospiraceae bacterium]|nr:AAA family ATPase [Lachnospiraceae bacterium]
MKILIFGIVASGKTTLAKKLSKELNIPYYEGDCIAWGFPGEERYKRTDEEQAEMIDKINENPDWIVEGTYRESQRAFYDYA